MSVKGKAESYIKLRGSISKLNVIHGKDAYEMAIARGFRGTVEEWFASLRGKDGDGKTPYIKDGYWWIGDKNTNVKAEGGDPYEKAVEGGFEGTEDDFIRLLSSLDKAVSIERGGTGASTAEEALQNLGIADFVSGLGYLKSESGQYTGTNTTPSLVFPFVPKIIIIAGSNTVSGASTSQKFVFCICYVDLRKMAYITLYNDYEINHYNGIGSVTLTDTTAKITGCSDLYTSNHVFYYVAFG